MSQRRNSLDFKDKSIRRADERAGRWRKFDALTGRKRMGGARAMGVIATTAVLLAGDAAADLMEQISKVEERWGEIRWNLEENEKIAAYRALVEDAERVRQQHPASARAWIWEAIALASYAGARADMGSLLRLRAARAAYERAIELGEDELAGFAYANLGTLYHRVPGWPISFRDDDRAREFLRRGLEADPESLDTHFAYGRFLIDQGEYPAAIEALERALVAAPGPIHARHHQARIREVRAALERAQLARRSPVSS
jgi:tetratricopeptide (TPR) repeat protein